VTRAGACARRPACIVRKPQPRRRPCRPPGAAPSLPASCHPRFHTDTTPTWLLCARQHLSAGLTAAQTLLGPFTGNTSRPASPPCKHSSAPSQGQYLPAGLTAVQTSSALSRAMTLGRPHRRANTSRPSHKGNNSRPASPPRKLPPPLQGQYLSAGLTAVQIPSQPCHRAQSLPSCWQALLGCPLGSPLEGMPASPPAGYALQPGGSVLSTTGSCSPLLPRSRLSRV